MMILKVKSNYDMVWFGPARIRLSDDTEVLADRANMSYIVTPNREINGFDIEVQWSYLHFFDMDDRELPYMNFNGATLLEILPPDCPVPEDFWYRLESCFIDGEEVAVSAQPAIPTVNGKFLGITKDTAEEITGYLLRTEGKINPGKAYICPMVNIYSGEYDKEAEAYDNCFGPFVEVLPDSRVADALRELQILPSEEDVKRSNLLGKVCCRKAFLRGVFMAGGSVSRPSGDYHMEIVTETEELARLVLKVMHGFSLSARMTDRKKDYIVYLKDGDHIITFLSIIGAHQALLEFENVRIVKEMRNNVNRRVNCETANLNKVIRASVLQVACIRYLQERGCYELLTDKLKEAAELRLLHPDISLNDLVEFTEGKVGKSGLNHRLKKIQQLAVDKGMDISEYD